MTQVLLINKIVSLIQPYKFVVKKQISSDTRYLDVCLKFIYQIFTLFTVQSKGVSFVLFVSVLRALYKTTTVRSG